MRKTEQGLHSPEIKCIHLRYGTNIFWRIGSTSVHGAVFHETIWKKSDLVEWLILNDSLIWLRRSSHPTDQSCDCKKLTLLPRTHHSAQQSCCLNNEFLWIGIKIIFRRWQATLVYPVQRCSKLFAEPIAHGFITFWMNPGLPAYLSYVYDVYDVAQSIGAFVFDLLVQQVILKRSLPVVIPSRWRIRRRTAKSMTS